MNGISVELLEYEVIILTNKKNKKSSNRDGRNLKKT